MFHPFILSVIPIEHIIYLFIFSLLISKLRHFGFVFKQTLLNFLFSLSPCHASLSLFVNTLSSLFTLHFSLWLFFCLCLSLSLLCLPLSVITHSLFILGMFFESFFSFFSFLLNCDLFVCGKIFLLCLLGVLAFGCWEILKK